MKTNNFEEINDMLGDIVGGTASMKLFDFSLAADEYVSALNSCTQTCSDICARESQGTYTGFVKGTTTKLDTLQTL